MTGQRIQPPVSAFGALQRFARRPAVEERCELCGSPVAPEHEHVLEVDRRRLVCACQACAILFSGQIGQRYKRVPTRIRLLLDFRLTDAQWEGLLVPINMAFFFRSTPQARVVALYPSPAGATESLLAFDTWDEIVHENPPLEEMEADVEALLVNRIGHARGFTEPEYYIVPIDQCFKLVGLIRSRWQGLSGGTEVWQEIAEFFRSLKGSVVKGSVENAHA